VLTTSFTELVGCRIPLQQAGMGGTATPDLAVAVAEAGALGTVALPMASPEAVAEALEAMAGRTQGAFGINFLVPFLDRASLEAAADKVRVVELFYDRPDPALVELVHTGGALAAWQVGSVDEARQAADAGCDLIIAQGVEAGGHVRGTERLATLLAEVVGAVDVPVVAAGGIGTADDVARAMQAGASAVRVGTRFLAAVEADVHPEYLARLIDAGPGDTTLGTTFSAMWPDAPHRALTSAVEAANAAEGDAVGEISFDGITLPMTRFSVLPPSRTTTGNIGAMALYAGESVGAVRHEQTAAEIVEELAAGLGAR
jgi:NAD(P)H-dependent flavin oxidoreductase YrpB (nitropropane dioxygenase family)